MQTLYRVKNPMRFSNNLHDFSIGKYRKVKINENNCKNNLTFCYFPRIPCVSPRVTLTTLTETQYENRNQQHDKNAYKQSCKPSSARYG